MGILIYSLEDDLDISFIINKTLSKSGYQVESFANAFAFFEALKAKKPDLILLDLMLPDMSGYDVLKTVRSDKLNDDIDIIIISAKHMLSDKIDGFDLGADDYIEKPFDILELISRVQARLRRRVNNNYIIEVDIFKINTKNEEVYINDQLVTLTHKEFKLLELFLNNVNKLLTREEIFKAVWNFDEVFESRTIDNHIKSLRSKIDPDKIYIKSIYGIGYKFAI